MAVMPDASSVSPQWIEFDARSLKENVQVLRRLLADDSNLTIGVNANGYDQGLGDVAPILFTEVDRHVVHNARDERALPDPVPHIMSSGPPAGLARIGGVLSVSAVHAAAVARIGEPESSSCVCLPEPVHIAGRKLLDSVTVADSERVGRG